MTLPKETPMIERERALTLGLRRYFTGIPCKKGHISERAVGNRECVECSRMRAASDTGRLARAKKWAEANREKRCAARRAAYAANRDHYLEDRRRYRERNYERVLMLEASRRVRLKDARRAYREARYRENPEAAREIARRWAANNKPKVASRVAKRRAAKLQATPKWADFAQIDAFYAEAARMSLATGVKHQVDHIVPLQSPIVCGLHVQSNLQVLTATENARKKNRMIDRALNEGEG